jgi:Fe2+ transport system protein B
MTSVTIPKPRDDAKQILKTSFELTEGIETYNDQNTTIIGKTGSDFGLLVSSYGEEIIAEIPEHQPNDKETEVTITGEKEVSVNIGADPQKYVSRFERNINKIKHQDMEQIYEKLKENNIQDNTKEVDNVDDQAGGKELLVVILLIMMFFVFIMPLLMI